MTVDRDEEYLISLIQELRKYSNETEWMEFKVNNSNSTEIGEYISALSNSAAYTGKTQGYMVWGIRDSDHEIVGTTFNPQTERRGNQELESWLLQNLKPKIDFKFFNTHIDGKDLVILEIGSAFRHPVQFQNIEYIRVGSYKKKLKEFPDKERSLWRVFDQRPFEKEIAASNINSNGVTKLIDYPSYFELLKLNLPESRDGILNALAAEGLIRRSDTGNWDITNLGAILFGKNLNDYSHLKRKSIRVIQYRGTNKAETLKERTGNRGYAYGFQDLIDHIETLLPSNEVVSNAFRSQVPIFPPIAIRELVVNALIHQDFHISGAGPMIEIFSNRMEITNPGMPLVNVDRLLDTPPQSRNEALASLMRRIGICEERGSGIDKVVIQTELYQLPAPIFETPGDNTRSILFSHKKLNEMDKSEKILACYMHAGLRFLDRDYMTNASLRKRFKIDDQNSAIASRIIKDTLEAGKITPFDEKAGRKYIKYIPWWGK